MNTIRLALLATGLLTGSFAVLPMSVAANTAASRIQSSHWAFSPITDFAIPTVKDSSWPIDSADRFILSRLESERLSPAPDCSRYAWLRRVSLDLTGLPPTPAQISDFVSDPSLDAYARVVDRLLASRAFGERWARHWLDLVGYADQIGTSNSIFAQDAWRYRDYVIDALNADKPFDQFVREQLAGDLLPYRSARQRAEQLIATGFLVLGDMPIVDADKEKLRCDVIDQQIEKVGKAFLGMTLACARCHDHKFDPILQADYYAIGGIFHSTESVTRYKRGVWSWVKLVDLPESDEDKAKRTDETKKHAEKIAKLKQEQAEATRRRDELAAEVKKLPPTTNPSTPRPLEEELKTANDRVKKLDKQVLHAEFFTPAPPQAFAVQDFPQPDDMNITIRGNAHALGDRVPRGFLRVIGPLSQSSIAEGHSGRRELAEWITHPKNPLTARVAVNRIWQKLFGEGIVRSVDYFGTRGEKPTHPELLDHLATRFVRDGWSMKKLIRSLVLSRAYRMSSVNDKHPQDVDMDNRLLWRMNRQRLDAEAIRDSMLAISGKLIACNGGPSLPLEYPENCGGLNPKDVNPPSFNLQKFRPEQPFERTVYLPIIRSGPQAGPAELRNVFDFTQPAQFAGQRATTSVPTQALFLMNANMLKDRSGELATRLLAQCGDTDRRLESLWLAIYNRPIRDEERVDAKSFIMDSLGGKSDAQTQKQAWSELCRAMLASNEFLMRL